MDYKTVYQASSAEIVEKKSRFIADVFPVSSEKEAALCLERIRKRYWDARHHCWAYVIREKQHLERLSDDKEPGGTAGRPILEVIKGYGVENVLVVVTRYFGGTLLGTGGLVRAYTSASRQGLAHSMIITKKYGFKLKIKTDYAGLGKLQYILGKRGLQILNIAYADIVWLTVLVPQSEEKTVIHEITEGTGGKGAIEREGSCWFADTGQEIEIFEEAE